MWRWLVLALGMAVSTVPTGTVAAASGASDPSIVIGFVATRSGAGAIAGLDAADGFALALKQLGGRFGNQEVRVVSIDDKGSPDVAAKAVRRLIQSERLDVVISAVSPSALAAMRAPLLRSRLFVLNLQTPPPALAGAECSADMFTLAPPADAPHQLLGQYLLTAEARKVVIVAPESRLADLAVLAFKRGFPLDVTVLRARRGAATYGRELARIAALRPDAVYSLLGGGMGGAFIRAYDEADGPELAPLYVQPEAIARPLLPSMGDAALDVGAVSAWSPDLEAGANKRMVADFEAEFGRPASEMVARGYDAALLLDAVLKAVGGKTGDGDAVRDALRRTEFQSVRGFFRFAHNHQPVLAYELITVVRDARGRLSHEVVAPLAREWLDPAAATCPMHWPEEYAPPPVKAGRKGG